MASFDQPHNGDGVAASTLFHTIASDVIRNGSKAVLKREKVQQLRGRCRDRGNITNEFDSILTLYGDESFVPIISNPDLNMYLENMALHLSAYITKANKAVANFIEKEFTSPTE
ncbi:hypothetical protein KI688_002262 [Linnemannia hyalina]|uniref:Uncharacterized protein n=1 Tax=Linnemannia hyalina TaxID=64524 RepID=A0A9P8BRY2_9FUNG|nr:hypothetical protein KI688_002262 [Linnemannia hyalina]